MQSDLPAARCPLPAARGFTIVEVMVAITLLALGALAVVSAGAAAVRTVGVAESELQAATAARNRLEALAGAGCSRLGPGSATDSSLGLRERWSATLPRNGVRLATDSVDLTERATSRVVVRHRLIVC